MEIRILDNNDICISFCSSARKADHFITRSRRKELVAAFEAFGSEYRIPVKSAGIVSQQALLKLYANESLLQAFSF